MIWKIARALDVPLHRGWHRITPGGSVRRCSGCGEVRRGRYVFGLIWRGIETLRGGSSACGNTREIY
jgi:hypothetical protein